MNILYFVPAFLGILFISIGAIHGWRLRSLTRRCSAPADATVVHFIIDKNKNGDMFYPVVSFEADGKTWTSRYRFGDSEWPFEAGNVIPIRYNPANPEEVYLYHDQGVVRQYLSPAMIIIGGLIFIATYFIGM